ncbi:hypothetical protein KHA89_00410 [Bacillus sp. FJAT-49731]|uniref:Uncharacterized protein n=1 Tax=Lederbergia citrea TaxID=2833581 RepID=A0A942Z3P9_9BACI|nr:hypothetical protein [Lederbergia citrea]MBS4202539.1 hypothetical protein [Lederbergia citrea]MBS4222794.1 hypothetical protein [Lederbergia citrea]
MLVWIEECQESDKNPYLSAFFRSIDGAVPDVADQVHLLMMWMPAAIDMTAATAVEGNIANVIMNLSIVYNPR